MDSNYYRNIDVITGHQGPGYRNRSLRPQRKPAKVARPMRVVDLDRDMRDVIPTGTTRDSEYIFERMTLRTIDLARPGPGQRVLDVASGFGQDAVAMAARGAWAVGL